MNKLYTFGDSFTYYVYPTWSDFLALEFDEYENWGIPGIGCKAIAERIVECHLKNTITKNDTVIVQWSTHLRHDFFNSRKDYRYKKFLNTRPTKWRTQGSIFTDDNVKLYDDVWLDCFFDEGAFVMHCLHAIASTQYLLDHIGCQWYMTSIGDWQKLSSDLDNISGHGESKSESTISDNFPEYTQYIDKIWTKQDSKWLHPISIYANKFPNDWWSLRKDNNQWAREPHPSPKQYVSWLNDIVRPKLHLGAPPLEQNLWLESLEVAKEQGGHKVYDMWDVIMSKRLKYWPYEIWPQPVKGFC